MRGRIPSQGGDEHDAFTRWRQLLHWQAGELRRIKRGYNKRMRKAGKRETNCE